MWVNGLVAWIRLTTISGIEHVTRLDHCHQGRVNMINIVVNIDFCK